MSLVACIAYTSDWDNVHFSCCKLVSISANLGMHGTAWNEYVGLSNEMGKGLVENNAY